MTLGSTKHCAVQGMYDSGRILSFQGYFEFDWVVNSEIVKVSFPAWAPRVLAKMLRTVDVGYDAIGVANTVLAFFVEGMEESNAISGSVGGLLTPLLFG
jgi:hypothetical protein